jgi:transcription elongation factor
MMFRNGYLYQEFTANKLITENVCPSLQEVRMFQVDPQSQSLLYDIDDDDQDEWDLLDDKTLQLTIKDDPQLQIQSGDRVKVIDG